MDCNVCLIYFIMHILFIVYEGKPGWWHLPSAATNSLMIQCATCNRSYINFNKSHNFKFLQYYHSNFILCDPKGNPVDSTFFWYQYNQFTSCRYQNNLIGLATWNILKSNENWQETWKKKKGNEKENKRYFICTNYLRVWRGWSFREKS